MSNTEQILTEIIKGIVSTPDAVQTHTALETGEDGVETIVINVKVADNDVGACIGKGGMTAEAIRKVIALIGFKELGKNVFMRVDAPKMPKNHFFNENK